MTCTIAAIVAIVAIAACRGGAPDPGACTPLDSPGYASVGPLLQRTP